MLRPRPSGRAFRPRPEPLELRALLSADYGQWPLRGADPASTLLVKFAAAPTTPAIMTALASVSGYIGKTYEDGTSLVDLGQGVDPSAALAKLEALPGVVFAEANSMIQAAMTPNDPSYPTQWGLNQANGIDIGAPAAWDTTTGSSSTIVAIVDTGIDMTSPEFAGRLWTNPADGSHGYNFVADTNNPQDDNGHGTHVAGIIGATGNNGIGVAGVNWNARLMGVKFLAANGSGSTAGAISAIEWAVDHGANVINASWGGTGGDAALSSAISYADSKGVVFVAAAGNNGSNNDSTPFYPATYHLPNMLTVAAVDSSGNLAAFSNYGATSVDLAAPGVNIYSTYLNGYATLSGTSMATPCVTGVVSLLEGLHPADTPEQIVALIKSSVKPLASLQGKTVTGGMVDAARAIAATALNAPKVRVLDGSTVLSSGPGVDSFGTAVVGTPATRTFTVTNGGNSTLTLSDPISLPTGFALAHDFGSTSIAPGASTSFAVSLTAASAGSYSGTLGFGTNDPSTPTFSFAVAGTVVPAVQQVASTDPTGFSTTGRWLLSPASTPGGSVEYAVGTGSDVATWSFHVASGNYRVSASWMPPYLAGTGSSYTVLDGPTPIVPIAASLATTPTIPGAGWGVLGTFVVSGSTLNVTLSDALSSLVIADAVKIEKV